MYDPEEEYYFLRPKPQTESKLKTEVIPKDNIKDIIKTKDITKPKTETENGPEAMLCNNIYSRIKYECKECHAEFKNNIALTTNSYSHGRKYLENR